MGMGIASPLRQLVARTGVSLFCLNIPLLAQAEQAKDSATEEKPALTVTGNVTLVNDYIWRGLTQTWGNPALQAGGEASHDSGGYLGFWGSNVSDRWVPGANLELDLYGGIRRKFPDAPDFGFDLGVIYVYYPDGDYDEAFDGMTFRSSSTNTTEVYAGLSYKWLSVKYGRTLSKFYGWNENNSGVGIFNTRAPNDGVTGSTRGSDYVELNLNAEVTDGWILLGQLGRQTIADSTGLDWTYYKLGVTKSLPSNWVAGLAYSGTNEPEAYDHYESLTGNGDRLNIARPRLVLSVSRTF